MAIEISQREAFYDTPARRKPRLGAENSEAEAFRAISELAAAEAITSREVRQARPKIDGGATNVFRGFTVIETFICRECGEGVSVERTVQ